MLAEPTTLHSGVWLPKNRPTITEHLRFVSKRSWDAENKLAPHHHKSFEFICIVSGRGVIVVDDTEIFLEQGDIMMVEPSSVHAGETDPKSPFKLVTLGYRFNHHDIATDPKLLGMDNTFLNFFQDYLYQTSELVLRDKFRAHKIIQKMISEILNNKLFSTQLLTAYLIEFFILMLRNLNSAWKLDFIPSKNNEAILKAQKYMRNNYTKPLSLEDISGEACLSPSHFCRLFKKNTHTTPKDYLNLVRIEKAKRFLKYSNITLTEIADRVGYSGIHYFSRCFKNKEGISPLEYRQSQVSPD